MAKQLLLSLLSSATIIASSLADAGNQNAKNPLDADFAKYMNNMLEKWHTAGIAIGIVDGDDVFTEVGDSHSALHDTTPVVHYIILTVDRDTDMPSFLIQNQHQTLFGTLGPPPKLSWRRQSLSLLPTSRIQL